MKIIFKIFLIFVAIIIIVFSYTKNIGEEDIEPLYDQDGIIYNTYDYSKIRKYHDLFYYEDDYYYSKVGVDLSSYQKGIDFNKLKEKGIEFVYLRVGYRGYQTGLLIKDKCFEDFYKEAKDAGLEIGVYFFSGAINIDEVHEEAAYVLEKIKDKKIDLPVVIDMEEIDNDKARTDDLSNEDIKGIISTFIDDVNKSGYEGSLYASTQYIVDHLSPQDLVNWNLWLAQYSKVPEHQYEFNIWQYTDNGNINDIDYPLDLDIMFIKKKNMRPNKGHISDDPRDSK